MPPLSSGIFGVSFNGAIALFFQELKHIWEKYDTPENLYYNK